MCSPQNGDQDFGGTMFGKRSRLISGDLQQDRRRLAIARNGSISIMSMRFSGWKFGRRTGRSKVALRKQITLSTTPATRN